MALLGCDVVATDQIEVLPLLMRNVERNTSRILQMNPGSGVLCNLYATFIGLYILQFLYNISFLFFLFVLPIFSLVVRISMQSRYIWVDPSFSIKGAMITVTTSRFFLLLVEDYRNVLGATT